MSFLPLAASLPFNHTQLPQEFKSTPYPQPANFLAPGKQVPFTNSVGLQALATFTPQPSHHHLQPTDAKSVDLHNQKDPPHYFSFPTKGSFLGQEPVLVAGRNIKTLSKTTTVGFTPRPLIEYRPLLSLPAESKLQGDQILPICSPLEKEALLELNNHIRTNLEARLHNDFIFFVRVYNSHVTFSLNLRTPITQVDSEVCDVLGLGCTFTNLVQTRDAKDSKGEPTAPFFAPLSSSFTHQNVILLIPIEVKKIYLRMEADIRCIGIEFLNALSFSNGALKPKEAFILYLKRVYDLIEFLIKENAHMPNNLKILYEYLNTLKTYKNYTEDVEQVTTYKPVDAELLQELTSDIKDHFETRLQNDFTLFLRVANTYLTYSEFQTQHQVGQADGSEMRYAAAHSCTFPNLVCKRVDRDTNGKVVDGEFPSHMFAYNSSSYLNRNATTIIPTEVNKIDTALEATIRGIGIKLLNDLSFSLNGLTSKEAFKSYLKQIVARIEYLIIANANLPNNLKILNDYLSVAKAYIKFFDHQPLENIVHKLTFTYQPQPLVNAQFYERVQSEMNLPLSKEMHDLNIENERRKNDETPFSGKALTDLNFCFNSIDVQREVRDYFASVSLDIQKSDLEKARLPKLSIVNVGDVKFSDRMLKVFNTCIHVIRSFRREPGVNLRKLNILFPRILKDVHTKPKPQNLIPTPALAPSLPTRAQIAKSQAQCASLNQLTGAALKHAQKMVKDKEVREIANKYFSAESKITQERDLKEIEKLTATTAQTLSPEMQKLVHAGLKSVRTTKKTSKLVPRQLNGIFKAVVHQLQHRQTI